MDPRTKTVALICANSVLRQSLTTALHERGHQVVGPPRDAPSPNGPARPGPAADPEAATIAAADSAADVLIAVAPEIGPVSTLDANAFRDAMQRSLAGATARGAKTIRVDAWRPRRVPRPAEPQTPRPSLIIRTAPPYGIGDDPITAFFVMMRTFPTVPVLTDRWLAQPLWHEDLARAVAVGCEIEGQPGLALDVAGVESIAHAELYDRVAALIDRRPLRIPLPASLVSAALKLGGGPTSWVDAFDEADGLIPTEANALPTLFNVTPTPIAAGLARLARELPEQTPAEGVGSVEVKRFTTIIHGAPLGAPDLLRLFRARFSEVMPLAVGVEPVAPHVVLTLGAAVTMALPGRGHVQVRVEDVSDEHVVLATLKGHAVAGFVRFRARDLEDAILFDVMTCDAAGSSLDWLALTLGSSRLQDANWNTVVENVVRLSGGSTDTIESDARTLSQQETDQVERWIRQVIERRLAQPAS